MSMGFGLCCCDQCPVTALTGIDASQDEIPAAGDFGYWYSILPFTQHSFSGTLTGTPSSQLNVNKSFFLKTKGSGSGWYWDATIDTTSGTTFIQPRFQITETGTFKGATESAAFQIAHDGTDVIIHRLPGIDVKATISSVGSPVDIRIETNYHDSTVTQTFVIDGTSYGPYDQLINTVDNCTASARVTISDGTVSSMDIGYL